MSPFVFMEMNPRVGLASYFLELFITLVLISDRFVHVALGADYVMGIGSLVAQGGSLV